MLALLQDAPYGEEKVWRSEPITVVQGENPTHINETDKQLPPFFVPDNLARMGHIPTT